MPELPEVERFRQLLEPLVSKSLKLCIELLSDKPPRTFLSESDLHAVKNNCHVANVLRKGKLICMVLNCVEKVRNQDCVYLFLHMGMTGRISTPQHVQALESLKDSSSYPPPHTCLRFRTTEAEACFSDPRRFGSVTLGTALEEGFEKLAPDALTITSSALGGFVNQSMGIKGILLDQRRVVSGVGNWVADEVLYQCQLHPDQKNLSVEQAEQVGEHLRLILETAVACLEHNVEFPQSWLFHCRWNKRSATKGNKVIDPQGRAVTFVTAAGRTSAIVPSIQKQKSQSKNNKSEKQHKGKREIAKKKAVVKKNMRAGEEHIQRAQSIPKNDNDTTNATSVKPTRRSKRLSKSTTETPLAST